MTKLLFDNDTHRVIGAGIVGPNAGELIAEIGLAIEMGCDAEDIALTERVDDEPAAPHRLRFSFAYSVRLQIEISDPVQGVITEAERAVLGQTGLVDDRGEQRERLGAHFVERGMKNRDDEFH